MERSKNGLHIDEHPRLHDGRRVIFAFVEDAERGPMLVTAQQMPLTVAIQLARLATDQFDRAWKQAVESRIEKLGAPPSLYTPDGSKLA